MPDIMALLKLLQKERKKRNANVTLKAGLSQSGINPQTPQTKTLQVPPHRYGVCGAETGQ